MKETKVSIVIPVYNGEKYLKQCIESLVNQTYQNIEIILVNDGSKDNTQKIIQEYAEKDNRIIAISQENQGQLKTRKNGIARATGEYLTFVDADDWVDTNMIKTAIYENENYNADIIRFTYIDEHIEENRSVTIKPIYDSALIVRKEEFKEKLYPCFLKTHQLNSMWGQLIRKELVTDFEFDSSIRIGEDLLFNIITYTNAESILFIPNAFYHYRCNSEGITNSRTVKQVQDRIRDVVNVYSVFYDYAKKWDVATEKNIETITNRILSETDKCINLLFTFKNTKEDKKAVMKYASELLEQKGIKQNTDQITVEARELLGQQYNKLILRKNIKFKLMYLIKKKVKQCLVIINKKKN
ncbi:MAG: glycosyltransferase family 2 protein [Clostridia bacterium]|nr:glycosyltransferase family 2 protein [Clostridia bacterium]